MGKRHKIKKAFNRLPDQKKSDALMGKMGGYFDEHNHFHYVYNLTESYRNLIISIAKQWEQDTQDTRVSDVLDEWLPEIFELVSRPTLLEKIGITDHLN